MAQQVNITSPVGRIVMGSLYDARTTDAENKPLIIKNGPNAGQPRVDYFFALAIPKGDEQHWSQTAWGQQIWAIGHQAFPHAASAADFAWKIIDGDSRQPGKLFRGQPGKPPAENEGFPGHWIIRLSGGYAPKVYKQEGAGYVQVVEPNFVKPGYFVEVAFGVSGNNSQTSPGVYLNHSMVCFRAYGPEITFGPYVASAGFGAAPLPAGASLTPPPSAIPLPSSVPNVPGAPAAGYAPAVAGTVPLPTASAPPVAVPAIPVVPNPQFVQVPAAPVRQMTALAGGAPYQSFIDKGWTDAMLVQHGYMLA